MARVLQRCVLSPASFVGPKATFGEKVAARAQKKALTMRPSLKARPLVSQTNYQIGPTTHERCPQPFELQMRCSLSVRGVKPRREARNPRANPHEPLAPLGQGWASGGGCSAVVSLDHKKSQFRYYFKVRYLLQICSGGETANMMEG